jgi:phospholipase C
VVWSAQLQNPEQPTAAIGTLRPNPPATEVLVTLVALCLGLSASGQTATGTIQDVRHVVILMQENRALDHYYGTLGGVRGFSDRNTLLLPNGNTDLYQPAGNNYVLPFHMPAPCIDDVDHSESTGLAAWDHGEWDMWVPDKGTTTMGYFTRNDMPYHYALADAYTICDNNYCSFIGPTFPNRLYLFTGMIDPNGTAGGPVLDNSQIPPNGLTWTTYPERLQQAGISWRVYRQNGDWFGDALMWSTQFINAQPGDPLYDRGMDSEEDQIAELAADVTNGTLPAVSWVIPNIVQSEHPSAAPASGAVFVQQLLAALAGDTNVLNSTVLIITYDENGGFFDHIPPPIPPPGTPDEFVHGDPLGLGIRVPMLLISPWSRGGRVCSQLFDHTSILRFLETWTGVQEPTISAWRRQVVGDLTSGFDFANPDFSVPTLPAIPPVSNPTIVDPPVPSPQTLPWQETNTKVACPLPYQADASATTDGASHQLVISMTNGGTASVHFAIYPYIGQTGYPPQFDVAAGDSTSNAFAINPAGVGAYDFTCFGPNGFQRRFAGSLAADAGQFEVSSLIDGANGTLALALTNGTDSDLDFTIIDGYGASAPITITVSAASTETNVVTPVNGWYDLAITNTGDASFLRLLAGHIETGEFSTTDLPTIISNFPPALGSPPANTPAPSTNAPVAPIIPSMITLAEVVNNLITSYPAPPPTNAPTLLVGAYTGGVALLYPAWASNGILQFSPDLTPFSWTALSVTSSVLSNYTIITQPATNSAGFFRLTH